MEVELANFQDVPSKMTPNFSSDVERAQDLLLFRKFLECLNVCQKSIRIAKTFPELECATQAIEDLCVLAIQAYAELNRWQEVLPFVNQVYEGIENCPPIVIQICLLLYAKVRDYTTCHAVSAVWLKRKTNQDKEGYEKVIDIFVGKVLIPQSKWTDISGFIDSCKLTDVRKRDFLAKVKECHQQHVQSKTTSPDVGQAGGDEIETSTESEKYSSGPVHDGKGSPKNGLPDTFKYYLDRFRQFVVRHIPVANYKTAKYLTLMGVSFYLLFYASHTDMVGNMTQMAVLWNGMVSMWRRMFSPYHISRTS